MGLLADLADERRFRDVKNEIGSFVIIDFLSDRGHDLNVKLYVG